MRRSPLAFIAAFAFCSGCAANAPLPAGPGPAVRSVRAAAAGHLTVTPLQDGYLRGNASGLRLWGERPWRLAIGGASTVTATSSDPSVLSVAPVRGAAGTFALKAVAVKEADATCPQCTIVQPKTVDLLLTATPRGGSASHYRVPVAIAHKIVAVSLNPLPNPSLGGSDAVLQYFDDNVRPSVIWDDFDLDNAHSFTNVGGLAFGDDGSLYVANSGTYDVAGTVTKYSPGSAGADPVRTFASRLLKSASAVAVDAERNVYVADNGFETVTRFARNGHAVTWRPGWEAGADVVGVAVDAGRGQLDIAMSGAGDVSSSGQKYAGRLAALPTNFTDTTAARFEIESKAATGVNEPYGIAVDGAGRTYVVNDCVSIVDGPPGPGPEYSTLAGYARGISSAASRPNATASNGLIWPLSVAVDVAGSVYVANNTPPSASGSPGTMWLLEYDGSDLGKKPARIDLSRGLPSAYGPYLLNVQGVAVDPSPLRQ